MHSTAITISQHLTNNNAHNVLKANISVPDLSICLSVCLSIYLSIYLQATPNHGSSFSWFMNSVDRYLAEPLDGDRPVARPLPKSATQTEETHSSCPAPVADSWFPSCRVRGQRRPYTAPHNEMGAIRTAPQNVRMKEHRRHSPT